MNETAEQKITRLEAENAELKAKSEKALSLKVSPKGAVQLNGLRRFPVTFYKGEWEKIFSLTKKIEQFIADNLNELAVK